MTIKMILAAAALSGCAALDGATLGVATAVQSQPDPASAVITVLKAGAEQPALSDKVGAPPPGWIAVDVPGPFEAYVKNKDLTKQLDVVPGSNLFGSPKDGSPVLTVYQKGDVTEITGLHGSWTQIRLDKTLVGYIQTDVAAAVPATLAPVPATTGASAAQSAAAPAQPAATDSGPVAFSKLFEGTLTGTRTLLMPKKPFQWQLSDSDGKRIAYVDLSKLLIPDQIDNYAGHSVVVLGSLEGVKDTTDLVIHAEGLRLK